MNSYLRSLLLAAVPLFSQQPADFHVRSDLVLIPFHVTRDKYYVSDLKQSDIVLLEDGKPRPFSIFEGPATEKRTLELVLLFDTTLFGLPKTPVYPPDDFYDFARTWDETRSHALLEQGKASVQASVYRFSSDKFQRLCLSTADPKQFLHALQQLPGPIPAEGAATLTLPAGRPKRDSLMLDASWIGPALLSAVRDPDTNPYPIIRKMVVFSTGMDWVASTLNEVSQLAADRGMAIYPVIFKALMRGEAHNSEGTRIDPSRISQPTAQIPLRRLADLTGGAPFDVTSIDANRFREILESIKNEGLSQYVVAFTPASAADTRKEHKLEIRLLSKSSGKLIGGARTATY